MADVKIALTTTPEQDTALDWLLITTNNQPGPARQRHPLPDVTALLTEIVQRAIEDAVPQCQNARQMCIATALATATPDQWAKVADVLGMKLP
jgi:hypothetical protein